MLNVLKILLTDFLKGPVALTLLVFILVIVGVIVLGLILGVAGYHLGLSYGVFEVPIIEYIQSNVQTAFLGLMVTGLFVLLLLVVIAAAVIFIVRVVIFTVKAPPRIKHYIDSVKERLE